MTDQERIKSILTELEYDYISYGNLHEDDGHGIRLIKEALEKQISKKIVLTKETRWSKRYKCKNCGAAQIEAGFTDDFTCEEKTTWCWRCGYKIDWSDEE